MLVKGQQLGGSPSAPTARQQMNNGRATQGHKGLPSSLRHAPSPEQLSPMPKGRDEVETAVHSVILDVLSVQAALITEVLLKLLVDVVSDGLPAEKDSSIKTKPCVQQHAVPRDYGASSHPHCQSPFQ